MNPRPTGSWKPADRSAQWTRALLKAGVVLAVVGIVSGLLEVELISRATSQGITDAEAAANDARQQLIGQLGMIIYLATIVAFLMWFHRVHRNLASLGNRSLKYSPGWAVGGFFIPFLNLVRPFQVMVEVWHGSDPAGIESVDDDFTQMAAARPRTPALVGWWWALFLFSGFLGQILFRLAFSENPSLDELRAFSSLRILSDIVDIPSALLAILLVGRITRWQSRRYGIIQGMAPEPDADDPMGYEQ